MTRLHRRKPARVGIRDEGKIPPSVERAHWQWIRGLACCLSGRNGHVCEGPVVVMHVRQGLAGGMGLKPPADRVIPGCDLAHRLQHQVGEREFEKIFGISMVALAEQAARQSPALVKWWASDKCDNGKD